MSDKTTSEQLASEMEAFREDIRRLQRDLADMLSSTGTYSREKLQESHMKIRAAMAQLRYQAGQRLSDIYETARNQGAYALDKSRQTIEQRPLMAISIAFAAGLLLSRLTERNPK